MLACSTMPSCTRMPMSSSVAFVLTVCSGFVFRKSNVDSPVHLEVALKAVEIDEDRAHRALLRPQRELTHRCARDHFTRHTPNGTAGIVLTAVQGLGWNIGERAQRGPGCYRRPSPKAR